MARGTNIRWGRVLVGAVVAELIVIALLMAITLTYTFMLAPGKTQAEYEQFAELAGYYVGPTAGAVSTFLMVLWVARGLQSHFILNGVLVAIITDLLTVGFAVTARPEHRAMYFLSFVVRIVAGYAGGWVSQRKLTHQRFERSHDHS